MRREDIRAFVDRRWDLVRDEKLATDARFYRDHGALACLEAAGDLYEHARRVAPSGEVDRTEDLRAHVAWCAVVDRVERGRARR